MRRVTIVDGYRSEGTLAIFSGLDPQSRVESAGHLPPGDRLYEQEGGGGPT